MSFLACSLKTGTPESIIVLVFHQKSVRLFPLKEVKALARSLNDKIPNIQITFFRHYDILAKTRCRMTMAIAFSRQNDDASRERTLLWENLVLVVVLESFLICKHRQKLHTMLKPFSDISLTLFKA